jgi:general secretion pathway protein F
MSDTLDDDLARRLPAGRLSAAEAEELAARVAELAKANLPLEQGLAAAAEEVPGRRLPPVLRDVARRLNRGEPLDAAMAAQGSRLPAHMRGLMLAGLRSGTLGDTLERFVHFQRVAVELRRKAWLSLAYPAVLVVMLAMLILFFLTFVVGGVVDVCHDFGIRMPPSTQTLFWLSGPGQWVVWLGFLSPLFAAAVLWLIGGPPLVRRALGQLPLVGPLWRWSGVAEFARLVGLLVERGLALPRALELAADGLGDAAVAAACRQVAVDVAAGRSFAESCADRAPFPPTLRPILAWGESSNSLAEALLTAGDMFEGRVRVQAALVETILPPIAFLFIAAAVLFLTFAVYSPMLHVLESLSWAGAFPAPWLV